VSNDTHINELIGVLDGVNDPVITHAEAPQVIRPLQLPHARRTGIGAESFNDLKDSARGCLRKPLELLSG